MRKTSYDEVKDSWDKPLFYIWSDPITPRILAYMVSFGVIIVLFALLFPSSKEPYPKIYRAETPFSSKDHPRKTFEYVLYISNEEGYVFSQNGTYEKLNITFSEFADDYFEFGKKSIGFSYVSPKKLRGSIRFSIQELLESRGVDSIGINAIH